jgi:hypothetical protein
MAEKISQMDGSRAHSVAMVNLESAQNYSEVLKKEYPKRHFDIDGGWGLVLPDGLAFINTKTEKCIRIINGKIRFVKDKPRLTFGKEFGEVINTIPDKAIVDVVVFTEGVKKKMYSHIDKKLASRK